MKKLRVLMLVEKGLAPPPSIEGLSEQQVALFQTEQDVQLALIARGHEVRMLEVFDDVAAVRQAVLDFEPDVAFNLLEAFNNIHFFDQHIVSYLELIGQPYTGCNPRGLTLARDKALTKKIMAYHRIRVPAFAVFPRGRRIVRPKKLGFPLLVKSINVEGSIGIAQASVVQDDEKLIERVRYIHESLETYAIAEQYIEGRELYVGVMGNQRLRTFPAWEMIFDQLPPQALRIASRKVKFDAAYQRKWGIFTQRAEDLAPGVEAEIPRLCKRIYRILGLTGYARLDFRLTSDGRLYLLEANPNPQIGRGEDFAASAEAAGLSYEQLLDRILQLSLIYQPQSMA